MMLLRHPPITSPLDPRVLARAVRAAVAASWARVPALPASEDVLTRLLSRRRALSGVLTDSGTSALVLAMRLLVPRGGTVALPAYACVDLGAAALRAGVRIRLYDVDPETLAPDGASLERAVACGCDAVVVVHLFGVPVDVERVRRLIGPDVGIIEDAAQGSGVAVRGAPAGSLGDVSVLSFGRGKGLSASGGGALLSTGVDLDAVAARLPAAPEGVTAGWRSIVVAVAQWALARPLLYSLPASIPALRLGEMVYHPAGEPAVMSAASVALLRGALDAEEAEVASRRATAQRLMAAAHAGHARPIDPIAESEAGWLRFPVVRSRRVAIEPRAAALGVVRPYPRTIDEEPAVREALHDGEAAGAMSRRLASDLVVCPTHGRLSEQARQGLERWLSARA